MAVHKGLSNGIRADALTESLVAGMVSGFAASDKNLSDRAYR